MCITRPRVCREKSALHPRIISRPEIEQIGARVVLLSGEGEDTASTSRAAQHIPIRLITPRQRYRPARTCQLPHTPQSIWQVIHKPTRLLLPNAAQAIQVGVGSISENLGQPGIQIQRVGRDDAVDSLPQAIAQAIIAKSIDVRALRGRDESVGGVIRVGVYPVVEQVAVRIPDVGYLSPPGHRVAFCGIL